jgi:hypothetical protein
MTVTQSLETGSNYRAKTSNAPVLAMAEIVRLI